MKKVSSFKTASLLILAILCFPFIGTAQNTYEATADGNFSNTTIWNVNGSGPNGTYPGSNGAVYPNQDVVTSLGGFTISLDVSLPDNIDLTIDALGTLTIDGSGDFAGIHSFVNNGTFDPNVSGIIVEIEDFTNNGTFIVDTDMEFRVKDLDSGGTNVEQVVCNTSATFWDLFSEGTTVSYGGLIEINPQGNFGNWDASATSNLSATCQIRFNAQSPYRANSYTRYGSYSVMVGTVMIFENHYSWAGDDVWMTFGIPLTADPTTIAGLETPTDQIITTGLVGTDWPPPGYTWVNIMTEYDETVAGDMQQGFILATDTSNNMVTEKGVWIYMPGNANATMPNTRFEYTSNQFQIVDVVHSLDYTANGVSSTDEGWNQFVSGFECTTDALQYTFTNISGILSVWDPEFQQYGNIDLIVWLNSTAPDAEIAANQAVWVQATSSGASVTVPRSSQILSNPDQYKMFVNVDSESSGSSGKGIKENSVLQKTTSSPNFFNPENPFPDLDLEKNLNPFASLKNRGSGVTLEELKKRPRKKPTNRWKGSANKSSEPKAIVVEFSIDGNENYYDRTCVHFTDDATFGYDPEHDALNFPDSRRVSNISVNDNGYLLSRNAVPESALTDGFSFNVHQDVDYSDFVLHSRLTLLGSGLNLGDYCITITDLRTGEIYDWNGSSILFDNPASWIGSDEEYYADRFIINVSHNPNGKYDMNGDGEVDSGDLLSFLASFGSSGSGIPGDFNNDGEVDSSDLLSFLGAFGSPVAPC